MEIPSLAAVLTGSIVLCGLCACAGDRANREEVERIAAAHERAVRERELAAELLAREHPAPQVRELGTEGTLVLHEIELAGPTGRELLRVRYSWVNTTAEVVDAVVVRLSLRDPVSGTVWTEDEVARLPLALAFAPDSSYTDELRLSTGGVHRREGWTWDIDARVVR